MQTNPSSVQRQQPEQSRSPICTNSCFDAHSCLHASGPRAVLTFFRLSFFFSSSCWQTGICRKSSSQQMKLTVHPIRANPERTRPLQTHPDRLPFGSPSFTPLLLQALSRTWFRSNRPPMCAVGLASLRCQPSMKQVDEFPALVTSHQALR